MTIDIGLTITILILSSILGLGLLVYFNNPKNKTNKSFAVLTFWIAIWITSNFLENEPFDQKLATLFLKIDFASASILAYFWFLFCLNFPQSYEQSKIKKILLLTPTIIFTILPFSSLVIYNIKFTEDTIHFNFGHLYPLYVVYIFSYLIIGGCGNLILKYKRTHGLQKIQILYVLLGFSISALIAIIINLFLQKLLPVELFRTGIYGAIFLVGFTTYAIIKKKLFEMKIVFTALFVLAIIILLLVDIFAFTSQFPLKVLKIIILGVFILFGYSLIKSVLTEIKYREELQKAYEELKVLDKAKSEFISMASHQLRTPLSAIKGYISMMLEGSYGQLPGKAKEKLRNVFISNERLIRIVNDLLNISKIELGKMELEKQPIQIEDLIQSCWEEIRIEADKKGLNLIFEKPKEALPLLMIDSLKMRQVILNLVDNAIKYTQKGEVRIKVEKKENSILISIKDTGEGLTEEERKNIFEGFTRGSAGITYFIEGTGLGLYVAKKFLELHGGKIWAESEGKGKGSTFYVKLPIN